MPISGFFKKRRGETALTGARADGIPGEVIAAIAAAVAAMDGGYTLRGVKKSAARENGRPVWAQAGIMQNTQPFLRPY